MLHNLAATPENREREPWATLRQFARRPVAVERCELCSLELPPEHQHLIEPATRQLVCACEACALLFDHGGEIKYRRVPREGRHLPNFRLRDAEWHSLSIPIGLAFFFHSSPAGRVVAIYPSPAGPTESLLEFDAWDQIVADNPVLKDMQPDAEALLVNRVGEAREYYLAPIDECYKLVGLIRIYWRGLSGGTDVWREIEKFFVALKGRSQA